MRVDIRPHAWQDEQGRWRGADFFPFVDGNPVHAIADCEFCEFYNPVEGELCYGWKFDVVKPPAYCGPICGRFKLSSVAQEVIHG